MPHDRGGVLEAAVDGVRARVQVAAGHGGVGERERITGRFGERGRLGHQPGALLRRGRSGDHDREPRKQPGGGAAVDLGERTTQQRARRLVRDDFHPGAPAATERGTGQVGRSPVGQVGRRLVPGPRGGLASRSGVGVGLPQQDFDAVDGVRGEVEGLAVVPGGGLVGQALHRRVARHHGVAGRGFSVPQRGALGEVVGEHGGFGAGSEDRGDAGVGRDPARRAELVVHGGAEQRVAEREPARAALLRDRRGDGLREQAERGRDVVVSGGRERGDREVAADRGSDAEHRTTRPGQAGHPLGDRRRDRGRHGQFLEPAASGRRAGGPSR